MIQFFANPGHAPGVTPGYLLDEISRYGSLSETLQEHSPTGELGNVDFFQFITRS